MDTELLQNLCLHCQMLKREVLSERSSYDQEPETEHLKKHRERKNSMIFF